MDIIIIGGGASGLCAAGKLTRLGHTVRVLEKMDRTALKLGITGKGRCNITNDCTPEEFLKNVVSNPKFLTGAIYRFPPSAAMEFFEGLGVPLKTERGSRVFPVSDRALDVVAALRKYASDAQLIHDRAVKLIISDGKIIGVKGGQRDYSCDAVILAAGGMSYPLTGSTGDGYSLARQAGHTIVEPMPSLVPIECKERSVCADLQGLTLKNIALKMYDSRGKCVYEDFGELLFTHFGITGPIVLSMSAHIKAGESYRFVIDLKPALDEVKLDTRLLSDFAKYSNRDFQNSLSDLAPRKLIPVLVALSKIAPEKKVNSITKAERRALIELFKRFTLNFDRLRPIEEAVITRGGVSVKEIDPKTMESKLVRDLYVISETLDCDAYTGGFNLQIAWSTAMNVEISESRADTIAATKQ